MMKNMDNKKKLTILISGIVVLVALIVLGITIGTGFDKKDLSSTIKGNNAPSNLGDSTATITCPSSIYVGETGSCTISGGSLTGGVTSSDSGVASVSGTGSGSFSIRGVYPGTVTFTATINGQSITSNSVSVLENTIPVSSVSVSCSSSEITVGSSTSCIATVLPSNATQKSVTWSTNATSIAVVSQSGTVTAREVGTVVVTARSTTNSSKYDTFTITVNEKPALSTIAGPSIIAIAADVGKVSGAYGANVKVNWGASGAGATFTNCNDTITCSVTFSHNGDTERVSSTTAKVTATDGNESKEYEVDVYSYCAWNTVDTNRGPFSDSQYTSMPGTREQMKFVTGCDAYEGWHKESDGWYYVNHYNRCCGGGSVTPPVTPSEACYIKRGNGTENDYCYGTSSKCSGFTEKIEDKEDDTSCDETPACYQNSKGSYVMGKYSGQTGYTYVGTSCPVTPPVVEENPACYVNETTGDYKWSTTSPGSGYTIDSSITSESACKKTEELTYACYKNPANDYVWATTAPDNTYTIVYGITSEETCVLPELPACYKDASNNYVWGTYHNDSNYTLVDDVLSEEDCHEKIDVPMTSSDVATIIYVFVAILLSFGIYVIYYVNSKKKLNK